MTMNMHVPRKDLANELVRCSLESRGFPPDVVELRPGLMSKGVSGDPGAAKADCVKCSCSQELDFVLTESPCCRSLIGGKGLQRG